MSYLVQVDADSTLNHHEKDEGKKMYLDEENRGDGKTQNPVGNSAVTSSNVFELSLNREAGSMGRHSFTPIRSGENSV